MGSETTEQQRVAPQPLPTDLVPVMRQHLHEALTTLNDAYTVAGAEDLIDALRNSRPSTHAAPLTRRLERSVAILNNYLNPQPLEEPDGVS